ncbi:YjcZ family sporulation protein [Paenibacillus sp. H1-7]|nr:YjcZ family sporulation protein [Paenibacillus sp. H1-7]
MGYGLGGVGGSCGVGGLFTSSAIILVLFILLVIITRGFLY